MILAAHQPAFLPWLGYLDKLAKADVFVVMDDLQFEAQNFQNRNRVKLNAGAGWLTVPLVRGSQSERIVDKRIDNTGFGGRHHWQHRIRRTLEIHYGCAPHFARYANDLETIFRQKWDYLLGLDLCILDFARSALGITQPIVRASTLNVSGQKTDRIIGVCEALGARIYLSGKGGSVDYLDLPALQAAGITPMWQRFEHPVYPQRYPGLGFISHLGFLDLLLNCGPESAAIMWPRQESLAAVTGGTTP